jgi:folate-binding protein YgfZ
MVLLDDLAVLTFRGADVLTFLQGYLTCDTLALAPGRQQATALCNIQGRVIAFGWVIRVAEVRVADKEVADKEVAEGKVAEGKVAEGKVAEEKIQWIVHQSLRKPVLDFMHPYVAFSKTTMIAEPADHLILGHLNENQADERPDPFTIDLVTDADELERLWELRGHGDRVSFDTSLINNTIPWLSAAVSASFLPQMLGLVDLGAVDFAKGCYLGQEVVARAQHRGQVKRLLRVLQFTGADALEPGAAIVDAAGKPAGTVIQSTPSGAATPRCLAVMREGAKSPFAQPESRIRLSP